MTDRPIIKIDIPLAIKRAAEAINQQQGQTIKINEPQKYGPSKDRTGLDPSKEIVIEKETK